MKIIMMIFFCLFIFSVIWSLKIGNIKVIGNIHTQTDTILAFAPELNSVSEYTDEELTALLKRIKERMDNTSWFYQVNIFTTDSKENTNIRNIIIEVSEGFLYRFGGGSIYGLYGKENVWGGGEYYYTSLGYDMQAVQFGSRLLAGHYFFDVNGGNNPSFYYTNNNKNAYDTVYIQNAGGEGKFGYLLNYDNRISALINYRTVFNTAYNSIGGYYSGGFTIESDKKTGIFTSPEGHYIFTEYEYIIPVEKSSSAINRVEINAAKYLPLILHYDSFNNLYFAGKIGVKFQNGENIPDYLKISLVGIDGIRSWNIPDLTGNSLVESHLELRWDFLNTVLLDIFNLELEALIFSDAGGAFNKIQDSAFDRIEYAYGIGLRAFFGVPVFIPLRLEGGWDKNGAFSLFFCTDAPF